MRDLNAVIGYWLDCIKNEDILGSEIPLGVRTKAILYPFEKDPFIFQKDNTPLDSSNPLVTEFKKRIEEKNSEAFYGYPILYYYDQKQDKPFVAPVFVIKLSIDPKKDGVTIQKDELIPSCGIKAFEKMGFKIEEIASINKEIEEVYKSEKFKSPEDTANQIIELLKRESNIAVIEAINPTALTGSSKLTKTSPYGLYNKSVLFAGENTAYNMHLLADLTELKDRNDLEATALSYLNTNSELSTSNTITPVMPFSMNEYQTSALESVFNKKLTVITGPPGTGKSQFIANLIINLFMNGKKVLFVSHTGEAVDVVNDKVDSSFKNLMIRTGNKGFRQDLKGKFNSLLSESDKERCQSIESLKEQWSFIKESYKLLAKRQKLDSEYESKFFQLDKLRSRFRIDTSPMRLIKLFNIFKIKVSLYFLRNRLNVIPRNTDIETIINKSLDEYYKTSKKYVEDCYIPEMFNNKNYTYAVNSFINEVSQARYYKNKDYKDYFDDASKILRIWSSTLKSIRPSFPLRPNIFDYVIFDESSQIDLPSAAPALYRARNAIVVGDPKQLSHISGITPQQDELLAKMNNVTEIDKLYPQKIRYSDVSLYNSAENSVNDKPILLKYHYRSQDEIISLCNKTFYGGSLLIRTNHDKSKYPKDLPEGVLWVNVAGTAVKRRGGSRYNQEEAVKIVDLVGDLLKNRSVDDITIGIVTPYNGQQNLISSLLRSKFSEETIEKHKIIVKTAHKFQGSERDVMIFSMVLASKGDGGGDNWYNSSRQILNVSLSRAKHLLYIVGDKSYCEKHTCSWGDNCILGKLAENYSNMKDEVDFESYALDAKFDTPTEEYLFSALQKELDIDNSKIKVIPKYIATRYTLDFAVISGNKRIDIECDGSQHEIVGGLPVAEDTERDEYLTKHGWEVLRFSNSDILSDTITVLDSIKSKITN